MFGESGGDSVGRGSTMIVHDRHGNSNEREGSPQGRAMQLVDELATCVDAIESLMPAWESDWWLKRDQAGVADALDRLEQEVEVLGRLGNSLAARGKSSSSIGPINCKIRRQGNAWKSAWQSVSDQRGTARGTVCGNE